MGILGQEFQGQSFFPQYLRSLNLQSMEMSAHAFDLRGPSVVKYGE